MQRQTVHGMAIDAATYGVKGSRLCLLSDRIAQTAPGLALACIIATTSKYISEHNGGPAMLFALLIGMAFNHLSDNDKMAAGLQAASRFLLRLGVALMGLRITTGQISGLGLETFSFVIAGVAATLIVGALIGRALGLPLDHAILSAGSVAICGASAALAIASVLPRKPESERNAIHTIAGVTTLSTVAMVTYPALAIGMGLDPRSAGVFIGATIHDVAQVVGAGYTISELSGQTATIVKLLRIACLLPVVVILGLLYRSSRGSSADKPALVPWFLIAFTGLVALNSIGIVGNSMRDTAGLLSQWMLLTAVSALGIKTSLREFAALGPRPLFALVAQTLFLATFALAGLSLMRIL